MKLSPEDRSWMHCIVHPRHEKVGRNTYRCNPDDVRLHKATRELKVHFRCEFFRAILPKGLRGGEAIAAVRLYLARRRYGNEEREKGRRMRQIHSIGCGVPNQKEIAEAIVKASPRTLRLLASFAKSGLPREKRGSLICGLIEYGERCSAYGLAIERGKAWHTLPQIREILTAQRHIEQPIADKHLRDLVNRLRIPYRKVRGRRTAAKKIS